MDFILFHFYWLIDLLFVLIKWYTSYVLFYIVMIFLISSAVQYVSPYQSKIRFVSCYAVYVSSFAFIILTVIPFFILNARAGLTNILFPTHVLGGIAKVVGIDYELKNGEVLSPKTEAAIIVSNHFSIWDTVGLFTKWHVMQKCTAVVRLKKWYRGPLELATRLAGVVYIDRASSREKNLEIIKTATEYIIKEKAKLWIFVEGTRNKNPEKLLPFKKGAFHVAICCQIPIIPVVISPYYFIDGKTMYFGKGKIIMEALEPIPTEGLTLNDMDDLTAKVYKLMSLKYNEFRIMLKEKHSRGQLPCCKNLK